MSNVLGLATWLALLIGYVAIVWSMNREPGGAATAGDVTSPHRPPRAPGSIDLRAARHRRAALIEPPPLALAPQRGRVDAEAGGGLLERRRLG